MLDFFGALVVIFALYKLTETSRLRHIPTVGWSLPLLSYIDAFRVLKHGKDVLQEGYDKYKNRAFKIAAMDRWWVIITGTELIEEVRKLPVDKATLGAAFNEVFQAAYTFGFDLERDTWHIDLIRTQLTRQIANTFPDMYDEVVSSFRDLIPANDEWAPIPMVHVMRQIVARTSSRVFVGPDLARNTEYLNIAINHTIQISQARNQFYLLPEILKPLAVPFIVDSGKTFKHAIKLLQPIIEERTQNLAEYGDGWVDKPNDMLMWIIETAISKGQDIDVMARMVLLTDFAAIHTTTNSFVHAVYHLAANPEFIQPLREEITAVVQKEGWSKAAMASMKRLDSFLRESQRLNGISGTSVMRKSLQDITLSDGTYIPKGTIMATPVFSTQTDEDTYTNPREFEPFRFSDMREMEGESMKHQFSRTSTEYIAFGYGRHACPGRFFAVNEIKAMFAHLVLTYDVKFKNEGVRPPNKWYGTVFVPEPTVEVLFRKRSGST
ncbi:cytochrome P450 [Abortiporus biennis]|nr:cytochrome P450 [Abortiporus biennis]